MQFFRNIRFFDNLVYKILFLLNICRSLPIEMSKVIKLKTGADYLYGPAAVILYPAEGTSMDWIYKSGVDLSYTIELRDTGKYDFLLPQRFIKPTCEENVEALKVLYDYVKPKIWIKITAKNCPTLPKNL